MKTILKALWNPSPQELAAAVGIVGAILSACLPYTHGTVKELLTIAFSVLGVGGVASDAHVQHGVNVAAGTVKAAQVASAAANATAANATAASTATAANAAASLMGAFGSLGASPPAATAAPSVAPPPVSASPGTSGGGAPPVTSITLSGVVPYRGASVEYIGGVDTSKWADPPGMGGWRGGWE